MPTRDRERINKVLTEMKERPLSAILCHYAANIRERSDVVSAHGESSFTVRPEAQIVIVHDILRRTSTTY
jgi:hypothetical protein